MVIYYAAKPRCFKGYAMELLPVHWYHNVRAWMTMKIFNNYFLHHAVPEMRSYCEKRKIPFKCLLLVDNAGGHGKQIEDLHPNVKIMFLPKNTTSLIQPMDQGVIQMMKTNYLEYLH